MDECLLYNEPDLYDLLFPNAEARARVQDAARRERIVASEKFYLEETKTSKGPVLELACGSGRLTIPIAQSGVEIVGADSSLSMLEAARAKAAAAGVTVKFFAADMRDFNLPTRYSLIILAGNSLQPRQGRLRIARQELPGMERPVFKVPLGTADSSTAEGNL